MKKLLALLFALVMAFCFISCDDDNEIPEDIWVDEDGGIHFPPVDYIPE